jgi:hypothetical protein
MELNGSLASRSKCEAENRRRRLNWGLCYMKNQHPSAVCVRHYTTKWRCVAGGRQVKTGTLIASRPVNALTIDSDMLTLYDSR